MEAKQVAQQQAERGKYIVLKALEEKKSTIIKAQGEAEAAKLVRNTYYRFIEIKTDGSFFTSYRYWVGVGRILQHILRVMLYLIQCGVCGAWTTDRQCNKEQSSFLGASPY